MNIFLGFLAVGSSLALIGLVVEYMAEKRDRKRFPPPGKLFQVDKRLVHFVFSGDRQPGEPLVVLETGMGSWSFYWRFVQPAVSKTARVCAYDRPGFGWSTPGKKPRTAAAIAMELYQALQTAQEPGPYLMVGHSLGGIFVRQFARLYPQEVCGMVLVDSAHEDHMDRIPGARQEAKTIQSLFICLAVLHQLGLVRLLGRRLLARFTSVSTPEEQKLFLATLLGSRYFETSRDECLCLLEPLEPEERLVSLGDTPLIVIQAGGQPEPLPRGYTPERWNDHRRAWNAIQQDLLSLSGNTCLVTADKSVHTVQVEQPEVVIEAVQRLLGRS